MYCIKCFDHTSTFGIYIYPDKQGNVYYTGYFTNTVSFGADTLKNAPGTTNVFLVKYSSAGNVIWAKQSNSTSIYSQNEGMAIAVDGSKNVFVTGPFDDTVSFGPDTLKAASINYSDIFLVKYDSNGRELWARQSVNADTLGYEILYSTMTVDNLGNACITGTFIGGIIFGSYILKSSSLNTNVFLVKYDGNGNILWAAQSNSRLYPNSTCVTNSVITDASGNIYITGAIDGTVSLGPYTISNNPALNGNMFIAKYDAGGKVLWIKQSQDPYGNG